MIRQFTRWDQTLDQTQRCRTLIHSAWHGTCLPVRFPKLGTPSQVAQVGKLKSGCPSWGPGTLAPACQAAQVGKLESGCPSWGPGTLAPASQVAQVGDLCQRFSGSTQCGYRSYKLNQGRQQECTGGKYHKIL